MLIFNCTKDAADFFTVTRKGKKVSPLSPAPKKTLMEESTLHDSQRWHWMVHVRKMRGKNVILAIDTDTRFSLIFWGLRKGGVEAFLHEFHQRLALHIIGLFTMAEQEESIIEDSLKAFANQHNEYAFVQRGDRSVQAHINDTFFGFEYEWHHWEEDTPTEEELVYSDHRNNDTPRKRKQDKDYIMPNKELLRVWLNQYASFDGKSIEKACQQFQETHRRIWRERFDMDFDIDEEALKDLLANGIPDTTETIEEMDDNVISFSDYTNKRNKVKSD